MAFIKSIISFIFAPLLILGGISTRVYVASPVSVPIATTTSEIVISSSTEQTKPATITTKAKLATTTKAVTKTKPIPDPAQSTPMTFTGPIPDFELINTYARQATVNIYCTTIGGSLSPISGTGVVVTKDGVILTNAHIAQYLLLKDFRQKDFIKCVVRTGSPAYPKYDLEMVYISPTWVENNSAIIKDQNPKGTGENDFAFLRIIDSVDGSSLPESFLFIPMDIRENIEKGEPVLLVSYPAGFLGGQSIAQNLNIASAITTIKDIFTFKEGTRDLLAVPGTVVSQKGSSGGLVVDRFATLIGIISTSSDGTTTSDRGLNAITVPYINRSMKSELGMSLEQFLSQDVPAFAKKFQEKNVPGLVDLITEVLLKTN
ncbi:MAG: serine protease [Minisyncoccia bacterium]